MAIKNTSLGGTDWTGTDGLSSTDLNDTFDAVVEKVQSLSVFWLNTDLYDEYDNFNSYSTGSFTTNTNWTVTTQNDGWLGTVDISNTQNAGGTTNEVKINVDNQGGSSSDTMDTGILSKLLSNNKHTFARIYIDYQYGDTTAEVNFQAGIDGTNYYDIVAADGSPSQTNSCVSNILVVALGSNNYDLYIGGKKVQSSVSVANLEIEFRMYSTSGHTAGSWTNATMYVDDIRQAKSETS